MPGGSKIKKRGFIMTGGGAKGLYEAGVIHAFHISGMEFDVITGSSIGAMNSIFFAEYLFHKRQLPSDVRQDAERAVEAMDEWVKSYHHAWLSMPDKGMIDDSEQGPIGQLKDDLEHFNLGLPLLARLAWWWTDPEHGSAPPPELWPGLAHLGSELVRHLGGANQLMRILKFNRADLFEETARTYLRRFGLERSLVPPDQDHKIKDVFTQPVSPLRMEHLSGAISAPDPAGVQRYILVDPGRSLCEYNQQGITVRLTRANYRTGRLEMSTYVPLENFVRFMDKQAWRLQAGDPEVIPVGSFRLQVPGNPNAINAGICSGRFPGVFSPYPLDQIYPAADPENDLLYHLVTHWLNDPDVETAMKQAYLGIQTAGVEAHWDALFSSWKDSATMRDFFPRSGDVYVDGGAIDNTPSNSAVDFVKEWAERNQLSKRDVELELYVIFLGVEPKSRQVQVKDPAIYQVVNRTLEIMGAAKGSSDANTVQTINTFGQRSENIALALKLVLESSKELLPGMTSEQQAQFEQRLYDQAKELGLRGYLGDQPAGILSRLEQWLNEQLDKNLPIDVEEVKIYPEKMPLSTLQFTKRLGYRKENAIEMLTMGCYNTLWALRSHLEEQPSSAFDDLDRKVMPLVKKWMGVENWPTTSGELESLRQNWQCQRTACVYHARYCLHGAVKRS